MLAFFDPFHREEEIRSKIAELPIDPVQPDPAIEILAHMRTMKIVSENQLAGNVVQCSWFTVEEVAKHFGLPCSEAARHLCALVAVGEVEILKTNDPAPEFVAYVDGTFRWYGLKNADKQAEYKAALARFHQRKRRRP